MAPLGAGVIALALLLPALASPFSTRWTQINGMRWGRFYNNPFNTMARLPNLYRVPLPASQARWRQLWEAEATWEGGVPPHQLQVEFPFGYTVKPNDTTTLGLLTQRPRLSWPADPNKLYTVMHFDHESSRTIRVEGGAPQILTSEEERSPPQERPQQFLMWVVTNIPGNSVHLGNEMFEYTPPLAIEMNGTDSASEGFFNKNYTPHFSPYLVYEQEERIEMEESSRGCSSELLGRVQRYYDLVEKYNLRLVAGNFVRVPWSTGPTEEAICRFAKCLGFPFPLGQIIPGITDKPECKPREDVMDVTLRGPTAGMEDIYGKYTSLYYPNSFLNLIRNTYPVISTGVIREFRALDGEFRNGASLAETLDGKVNVALLVYKNADAAIQLFTGSSPEAQKILGAVLPALATQGDYKVLLVQPENQDWDANLVARYPGNLIDMEMVKVKEGQEENFQKLRNQYKVKSRSSNNIMDVVVFKVVQDTLESLPENNLFRFPATNNELTLTVYRDAAARQAALRENLKDGGYEATFDCIACTLITTELERSYYPPYPADTTFPAFP